MVIQYVEFDVSDYWFIQQYCTQMRYDLVVTDPTEGLQLLEGYKPDAIVVDVMAYTAQPAHDLIVSARQIGYSGPILAIAGCSAQGTMSLIRQAGCDEVLLKPYTKEQLTASFSHYLHQYQQAHS